LESDYKGDLEPRDCWELLKSDKNAYLIDCRTKAEWQFVGVPDLSSINKNLILVEWQVYPSMSLNEQFYEDVSSANLQTDSKLIVLCRSGGRSKSAAEYLSSKGFKYCYNCVHGFEGIHDQDEHRGNLSGWKYDKLPWKQI
tara:strand:- start:665 stop:1087 length:423 start_codon:yes stop_codon:yes gene_type:complete